MTGAKQCSAASAGWRVILPALALFLAPVDAAHADYCEPLGSLRITGYAVTDFPGRTFDGTSTRTAIATGAHIAAASWNIPIGTLVRIAGLDFTYRIADRGALGSTGWIDVLVKDRATAYQIETWIGGSHAPVCYLRWGPG